VPHSKPVGHPIATIVSNDGILRGHPLVRDRHVDTSDSPSR